MAPPKKADPPKLTLADIQSDDEVAGIFIITPEMAEKLIEEATNPLNRPVSDNTVDEYADQMKKGKWRLNGESIIFSKEGLLLDGQHRLWACYKANKSFTIMVTRGVDKETFATIDTGKKRSGSDALVIHAKMNNISLKYTTNLSAAATLCIQIQKKLLKTKGSGSARVSRQDIIDFVEKHPDLLTWVERSRVKKSWVSGYSAGLSAICYLASKNGFEMKAMAFMHGFVTGENLDGRSPIMALRNRLGTEKNMIRVERLALIIHALNKFIDNEPLMVMKMPKGEIPVIHESLSTIKKRGRKNTTKSKEIILKPSTK